MENTNNTHFAHRWRIFVLMSHENHQNRWNPIAEIISGKSSSTAPQWDTNKVIVLHIMTLFYRTDKKKEWKKNNNNDIEGPRVRLILNLDYK